MTPLQVVLSKLPPLTREEFCELAELGVFATTPIGAAACPPSHVTLTRELFLKLTGFVPAKPERTVDQ